MTSHADPLYNALRSPLPKKKVDELARLAAGSDVGRILELCFDREHAVAFRASWILENIFCNRPDAFAGVADQFISRFHEQNNGSGRRHFTKILAGLSKMPGYLIRLSNHEQQLAETVFTWLIDPEVAVAVKAHCLQILANFSVRQTWIRDELKQTMDFLAETESVAFFTKAKHVRRQLDKA